ncbi:hypothetical protein FDECE_8361 [Fusarium decemcellulare]|nr:hypothetical protein FDECE_8361 [Fusarium decemcellulare]
MSLPLANFLHNRAATYGASVGDQTQPPSSTRRQALITDSFCSTQSRSSHCPKPPLFCQSHSLDKQTVKLVQLLMLHTGWSEHQLLEEVAAHANREAKMTERNAVVTISMSPETRETLSDRVILDRCDMEGVHEVIAVQRPKRSPGKVLLIVRSEEHAQRVRRNVKLLERVFSGPDFHVHPRAFYIVPAEFSKDDLKRMAKGPGAKYDYPNMFQNPRDHLAAWRRETQLDIKDTYWKYGYLWLVLDSLDDAKKAVSGKVYSLLGLQTKFISRDPRSVPMQCFNCQQLGHMVKECPRDDPVCGYCTLGHATKACPHKDSESLAKCVTCGGGHPSYGLKDCNHPKSKDMLAKCKLWRGPAHWDKKAASRIRSALLRGEHVDNVFVNDMFSRYDSDDSDEVEGHYHNYLDDLANHDTGSLHSSVSSLGNASSPAVPRTTSPTDRQAADPMEHEMTNPMLHQNGLFSHSPGTPIPRNPSPSPSVSSSGSRASLAECLADLPRSPSGRTSQKKLLETVDKISRESASCLARSGCRSPHSLGPGPASQPTTDLGAGSTLGSSAFEFRSELRLDPEATVNSMLRSLSSVSPSSATQVGNGSTVAPIFSNPRANAGPLDSPVRGASDIPSKRSAGLDGLGAAGPEAKRPRWWCEEGHSDEPMASQAENSGTLLAAAETATSSLTSTESRESPACPSATLARDTCTRPPIQQAVSHGAGTGAGNSRTSKDFSAPKYHHRDSLVPVTASFRRTPPEVKQLVALRNTVEHLTQLGGRPGSSISRDATPNASPARALDRAGLAQASSRTVHISASADETVRLPSGVTKAAVSAKTPSRAEAYAENASSGTSFPTAAPSPQGAGDSWTRPETGTSSTMSTPAATSTQRPTSKLIGDGHETRLPAPTPVVSPVPQQDQRVLRSRCTQASPDLDNQPGRAPEPRTQSPRPLELQGGDDSLDSISVDDSEDEIKECIFAKTESIRSYFPPIPGPHVG